MSDDLVKQFIAELQDLVQCRCHEAFKGRGLHDPDCHCDTAEAVKVVADRIEELEAKLAKAVGLLEAWVDVATHCTIEEGVCCCGDNMDTHAEPMDCGHSPVDHGAYIANGLVEETNATLAELTGGKNE